MVTDHHFSLIIARTRASGARENRSVGMTWSEVVESLGWSGFVRGHGAHLG